MSNIKKIIRIGHKKSPFSRAFYFSGGERGIRTPGPVTVNGFQDRRNRPLCHFSATNISDFQKLQDFESKTSKSFSIGYSLRIPGKSAGL